MSKGYVICFEVLMKNLLYLFLIVLSTIVFADNFDNKVKSTDEKKLKTIDIKTISLSIEKEISSFYKLLPEISGTILSLPKAGTIGVGFNGNEMQIHEGMKLVAKRTGINKPLTGEGILYLKYNKYNKLVGKYTRSQVGKFEIGDKVNSKWYRPTMLLGTILDRTNENQDLAISIKKSLTQANTFLKNNKKTSMIMTKISTIRNTQKEMKKLFGLGVDYIIEGEIIKKKTNVLIISIVSTYTGKIIFKTKVVIGL